MLDTTIFGRSMFCQKINIAIAEFAQIQQYDYMAYRRILNLPLLLEKKSYFLFGARGTGKSSLIEAQFPGDEWIKIDLLASDFRLRLSANPGELATILGANPRNKICIIDEVQKVPDLLDEVHRLIEKFGIRFLLTGSSARKLRRGKANMLAGRARTAEIFPLTSKEIGELDLERYLRWGGLPFVYDSDDPDADLKAYAGTYVTEEIQAEGNVRGLPAFSRFLKIAALSSGKILNFTKIGTDAQVSPSTVREYFRLLEDTLIGFTLEPWRKSRRRKAVATAKFYFFDIGVAHTLSGLRHLDRNSDSYGNAFEQFIGMELRAALSYRKMTEPLSFWRSEHDFEVDFLVGERFAIEVKSTIRVVDRDLRGLKALGEERFPFKLILISQDPIERVVDDIHLIPWQKFLGMVWDGFLDER